MELTDFYLTLGALIFSIGTFGVLIRKNAIVVFMCVELMLNAVNLTLVALSNRFHSLDGQVYVFFLMTIAAAEAAVGLAIIISLFRSFHSIETSDAHSMQG